MSILSVRVTPAQTIGPEVNYSFYGHAATGWGFSNATVSDPGPNVTVYLGDIVTLTLVANDTLPHNWFIDYDGDLVPSPGEPSSPDFNTATGPKVIVWNFTADRGGQFTYRCRHHPTTMTGTIEVLAQGRDQNRSLFGHTADGWGLSNGTISDPGPTLVVGVGATVTLTLLANDTLPHNWFIDYDGDLVPSPGEPSSPDFNTATGPKVIVWNFTADRGGQFTYRCRYHPTTMTGTIIIVGESPLPPLPPPLDPVLTILLGTIAFVLLFAAGYHARAVRARRQEK